MPEQETTCAYGADSDIDARYLAGALSATESEAFEEHYFGCDRCFDAVKRGLEIRAAMSLAATDVSDRTQAGVTPILKGRRRFASWHTALAAAAVVIVAFGVREMSAPGPVPEISGSRSSANAARGAAPSITLTSHATSAVLVAAWSPPSAARSYRVRLLGTDGTLLFERETSDTSIMLSRDLVRDKTPLYWEVQALDALRSVVATSSVVQAQTSPSPP